MSTLEGRHKGRPKPGYFIIRKESGAIVPLIAADELPHGLEIINVPRTIELQDAIGMLNLGLVPYPDSREPYEVILTGEEGTCETDAEKGKGDGTKEVARTIKPNRGPEATEAPRSPPLKAVTQASSSPLPKIQAKSELTSVRPVSSQPTSMTCRHWCTHGICKWGQQCRYRHIMPMTLPGLREIGLLDWPAWYRTLNPEYFASSAPATAPAPPDVAQLRKLGRRDRNRVCNNRDCCGVGKTEKAVVKGTKVGRFSVTEKESGRILRREELGEKIVRKLREMSDEAKVEKEKAEKRTLKMRKEEDKEKSIGGGARRWEDESESESEDGDNFNGDEENVLPEKVQGKLVDV